MGASRLATGRRRAARCALALLLAGGAASPAFALDGATRDPTLPPPAWIAAQPPAAGGAAVAIQDAGPPRVEMVVIGKTRRFALVDGKVVKAGDAFNESTVANVTAAGIATENRAKSLSVTPNVEKKSPARPVPKKTVVVPADNPPPKTD